MNSVNHVPQPRVGDGAMFIVWPIGRCAVEWRNCWSRFVVESPLETKPFSKIEMARRNQAGQCDRASVVCFDEIFQ
ncbi:hypothetical protein [Burkholderia sp. IT-111MI5]|uniref:hypothetical protein n=1 Tax=Burkholderia sp. IT-111MI5 TaxID=3026439 RepID=UPI0039E1B2DA